MIKPRLLLPLFPLLAFPAMAQETIPARTLPPLQVLESRQVVRDGRTITYQRVAPPVLPPTPAATPAPAMEPARALALTAERQRRAAKKVESLLLTATVYDRQVTELRWHQQGREYRAWSHIDFNHLAGVTELETTDHIYQLVLGVTNQTVAQVEALNASITARGLPVTLSKPTPPAIPWSAGRAEYQFVPEAAVVPAEVLNFLDTLHADYDAHRTLLAEHAAQRSAEQAVREQWLKEHPPVPKDKIIRFWRKASSPSPTSTPTVPRP